MANECGDNCIGRSVTATVQSNVMRESFFIACNNNQSEEQSLIMHFTKNKIYGTWYEMDLDTNLTTIPTLENVKVQCCIAYFIL